MIGIYTSAIIKKNEKFLLTKHRLMPGGKPEEDETAEECLKRELYEELAIRMRKRMGRNIF